MLYIYIYIYNIYRSEGVPLTGYLVPGCVGIWAWTGWENSSAAAAVAAAAAAVAPLGESNILFNVFFIKSTFFEDVFPPGGNAATSLRAFMHKK